MDTSLAPAVAHTVITMWRFALHPSLRARMRGEHSHSARQSRNGPTQEVALWGCAEKESPPDAASWLICKMPGGEVRCQLPSSPRR